MIAWLFRGVVMSAVHIGARVLLGLAIVASPLESTSWKTIAIAAVVLISLIWGGVDGIIDGRAHDDPDNYRDLTMVWLKAGLLAGLISGIAGWILGNWVMSGIGQNSLPIEIFAGGSFTTLLVFVPALAGAAIGRFLTRRQHRRDRTSRDNAAGGDLSYQQTQPVGLSK